MSAYTDLVRFPEFKRVGMNDIMQLYFEFIE